MWVPARTPDAIVRRLNQESVRVLARPEVGEKLLKIGQEPVGGTPEQFAETIQSEIARVGKLVRDVGIRAEGS
ncbi:Tripartite tricarboxylate transporter family receptor [compost metagenome]